METKKKNVQEIFHGLLHRYPQLQGCSGQIDNAYQELVRLYEHEGCLYIAGNGGSAADSEHIVGELMKSFLFKRKIPAGLQEQLTKLYANDAETILNHLEGGLAAVSLPSLVALGTAVGNDVSGDMVYAQMISSAARKGDVFLGISTSGNSRNIIHALMVAKAKEMVSIGLTGENRCQMDGLADIVIHVPEKETYKIQELHLPVYHALCAMLEAYFFDTVIDK